MSRPRAHALREIKDRHLKIDFSANRRCREPRLSLCSRHEVLEIDETGGVRESEGFGERADFAARYLKIDGLRTVSPSIAKPLGRLGSAGKPSVA